jgi:hypothetical protein
VIKKSEVTKLLGLAAAYDQRTVGEADVEAWSAAGEVGRWSFAAARRAIVEHYARDADRPRITPAAVSDRIRTLRGQAAESFEAPVIPPELNGADYPRWYRAQLAEHIDGQLDRWASTGQEPDRALPAAGNQSLADLIAAAPEHVRGELAASAERIRNRRPR